MCSMLSQRTCLHCHALQGDPQALRGESCLIEKEEGDLMILLLTPLEPCKNRVWEAIESLSAALGHESSQVRELVVEVPWRAHLAWRERMVPFSTVQLEPLRSKSAM